MCGIAGFAGSGDAIVLRRMTDAIRHRGPDAEGFSTDDAEGIFLGHRRLAIVDLAGGGQPMWTRDGACCVTYNGEIYNHEELRAELKARGCEFVTDHSDTEVLLHGYREWGESFVSRLNGMWAFVIYDRARKRLFGSRDRFGKKPLYYFHEAGTFAFASEIPALLQHPDCPRKLSPLSLKKYFAYCYIPAPRSIFERVWKLPGGCSFTYDAGARELKTWRYWEFEIEPEPMTEVSGGRRQKRKTDEWCEQISAALEAATKRRLMSDVPLGIFLSGGIDSSAIAAFAAKHVSAGRLNTFSIGFDEPSFDESHYARLMADALGARHHHENLGLDQTAAILPEIIAKLGEPLGDGSLFPTYLLSRFTRQQVTVALGGDGGDELFAGYDPFRALRSAERYARLVPRPMHHAIRLMASRLPVSHANISLDFKIKRTLMGLSHPPKLWNAVWMGALEPGEIEALFREPSDPEEIYSEAIETWDRCRQPHLVDRTLQFFTCLYLQDVVLAKVDRASMMCSLEARSPFLDIEVVNIARRIPWQFKLRDGQTKWILKKALAPLLPREIVDRPKKGFGMPIGRWLREGRFPFDYASAFPHLDVAFTERKHAAHMAGRSDERLFLWCYWLLSEWMKKWPG